MKPLTQFVTAVAITGMLATSAAAQQQYVLDFDDIQNCSGGALGSYQSWISLINGVNCQSSQQGSATAWTAPNYLSSSLGQIGWSFLPGPVSFNGMWASGFGYTFLLEVVKGGNVVHSKYFSIFGTPTWIASSYTGQADEVRFKLFGTPSNVGVDNITFTSDYTPPTQDPVRDLVNTPAATPEPATMLLVASGLGGLGAMARRRRRQARAAQG